MDSKEEMPSFLLTSAGALSPATTGKEHMMSNSPSAVDVGKGPTRVKCSP